MRVTLLVAGAKITGAAAVAELWARALRSVGVDTRLVFTAGRNLEVRHAGSDWATADLVKERTPWRAVANLRAVRRHARWADVVVCHLPHDHALCALARVHRRTTVVRALRHPRHLRSDPWHRWVGRRCHGLLLAHTAMAPDDRHPFASLPATALPVPVPDGFQPGLDGSEWRQRLELGHDRPVVGVIGKLAAGRGFELALDAVAAMECPARLVVVGHGELEPVLRARATRLGLDGRIRWAGLVEDDLESLYATFDTVLFTAAGSDWGHRAISEAQACARPVVAADLPGVRDLVDPGVTGVVSAATPGALADTLDTVLADRDHASAMGRRAADAAAGRRLQNVGTALARFLEDLQDHPHPG